MTESTDPFARFFWTHIHRTDAGASCRWSVAIFILLVLFPGVGSGGSVLAIGMFLCALLYWLFDPARRRLDRLEQPIVYAFAAYFLVAFIFAFGHAVGGGAWGNIDVVFNNIMFLLFAPVFPVLRHFARPVWIRIVFAGIAFGPIVAGLIVLVASFFSEDYQRSAFSGNALMLALGAMVSGLLCVHGLFFFRDVRMRGLLVVGTLAGFYALLSSGSRGPLLTYGVVLVIYGLVMGQRYFGVAYMARRGLVAAVALGVLGFGVVSVDTKLAERYHLAVERMSNPFGEMNEKSIYTRLLHYRAGLAAVREHPLTGSGRQNVMRVALAKESQNSDFLISTHLHNGYLTDFVASGILGLLSLLAALFVPLCVLRHAPPLVFGGVLCVTLAYGLYGMSNLLFYHDISTLLYLSLMAIFTAMARLPALGHQNDS